MLQWRPFKPPLPKVICDLTKHPIGCRRLGLITAIPIALRADSSSPADFSPPYDTDWCACHRTSWSTSLSGRRDTGREPRSSGSVWTLRGRRHSCGRWTQSRRGGRHSRRPAPASPSGTRSTFPGSLEVSNPLFFNRSIYLLYGRFNRMLRSKISNTKLHLSQFRKTKNKFSGNMKRETSAV